MNRTDRLYAIVEELRVAGAAPTPARRLADRFEVSSRTIERDILALQEAGVPIYSDIGRTGGYRLDATRTLPPLNFTPAEAAAIAVALGSRGATPLPQTARSALTKILAAMSDDDAARARRLGERLLRYEPSDEPTIRSQRVIEQAIVDRRVLNIEYEDKEGAATRRSVEPIAIVGVAGNWYLSAWCRLRSDDRVFRLDRIRDAILTREVAPERDLPGEIHLAGLERRATFE